MLRLRITTTWRKGRFQSLEPQLHCGSEAKAEPSHVPSVKFNVKKCQKKPREHNKSEAASPDQHPQFKSHDLLSVMKVNRTEYVKAHNVEVEQKKD